MLDVQASGAVEQLTQVLGVAAAALFLGAGVLRTARWRIVGDGRSLLMGAALIVLGGLAIPLTSLAGVIMGEDDQSLLRATTAVLTTGVTLVVVFRALTAGSVEQPHPIRLLVRSTGTTTFLFVAAVWLHTWAPELLHSENLPPKVLRGSLLAVAWLYVGLEATLRSEERPWAGKVAPLLGCMGVAELLHVVSVYHADGAWELASAALVAGLAAITAHRALIDLDEAATSERAHLDAVAEALHHTRAGMSQARARREEMVHDARNALAGLRAALVTLEKYDGVLDAPTSVRLRTAALGEISHLEHLIVRGDSAEMVDFDLAEIVTDVVEAQRATGLRADVHVDPLQVHGRPGDLATSLRNLLVNARLHGGGGVTVRTVMVADRVEIHVADRGPGLSDSQVATLFQRGARGPESRGSGLGLHVSRTLMRQQGGDLELRCHHRGAVFALVVTVAQPRQTCAPPEERPVHCVSSPGQHISARPVVAGEAP